MVDITPEQWEKTKCGRDEVKFVRIDDGTFLRSDGDHGFTDAELVGPDLASASWDCLPWNEMEIDTITVTLKPRKESE